MKLVLVLSVISVFLIACSATGGATNKVEVTDKNSYEYHIMCIGMLNTLAANSLPNDMKVFLTASSGLETLTQEKYPKIKSSKQRSDIDDVSSIMYGINGRDRGEFINMYERHKKGCLSLVY